MKRVVCLVCWTLSFGLTGCIDFNPNRNNRHHGDLGAVVEAEAENPQDDAAMDRSSHLKFKGVPIDGTLKEFVGRMKRHGFEVEESGNGAAVLSGDFAAFKSCTVYVETLTGKDLVARIAVGFPFRDQWEALYGDYAHLKSLLTEKYGEPASCVEEFQDSYDLRDDRGKMYAVKFDKCKYETSFAAHNGEIVLRIWRDDTRRCFVTLVYRDKENNDAVREHALNDL